MKKNVFLIMSHTVQHQEHHYTKLRNESPFFILLRSSREEGNDASGSKGAEHIVVGWCKRPKQHERPNHHQHKEESIVVEQREGGGLGLSHLILLPQHPFILLFLAHLDISTEALQHLARYSLLNLLGHLVLEDKLGVLISHGHKVGGNGGDQDEDDGR